MNHDAYAWAEGHRTFFEDRLRTLVELPTVSADLARTPEAEACAEAALALIRHFGGTASLLRVGGRPYVHGRFGDPGRPSVLIYNHLDVQPADEPGGRASRSGCASRAIAISGAAPPTTRAPR